VTKSQFDAVDAERVDPERVHPKHARSERVARPTPRPDAQRLNDGLDRGGPMIPDEAPNESDLPGPAHTKVTTKETTP
jgi:hypothetical protein